ncbi:MAG: TonB-dependent receptor [Bacteroidia bacterium]|nr:TonB-dependent receptor [Bacteroidia bacterium]
MNFYYTLKRKFNLLLSGVVVFLLLLTQTYGQAVTGTVRSSEDGAPIGGVTVLVKGTSTGAFTDDQGKFTVNASLSDSLIFSYIGFETFTSATGNGQLEILLKSATLDEVLLIGYGTSKLSDLTGAVSSVSSEELTQVSTPNVLQALQGRAPGVQIVGQSGEPGGGVRIRIRGVGSINNSDPLFVVDGFQTGDLSFLNPNDIEKIEILKDASATAIYGSRGANGVVLITTKRGKAGKTRVEFNAYSGVQQAWNTLDMLGATDFAKLRLEAYANDGIDFSNPEVSIESNVLNFVAEGNYQGTDWQQEVLRRGSINNYTLGVSGGGEKNSFSLTATYFDEKGIVKNSDMRRVFVRLTNDFQVSKWLTAKSSIAYVNTDRTYYNGDYFNGVLPLAVRSNPIREAWDAEEGNWGTSGLPEEGSNAARIVDEGKRNKGFVDKLVGNFSLNAEITKGLTLTSLVGIDLRMTHNKGFFPQFYISPEEERTQSNLNENRGERLSWQWSNFLNYTREFGKNNLNVLLGVEAQEVSYRDISISAFDVLEDEDLQFISSAQSIDFIAGSSQFDEALASSFSRVQYTYDDRYSVTANFRYDGSSRFTAENRWGFFPSFAGRWNISNESFFPQNGFFSNLALRAGWGQVGNQNSARNYGFVTTVNSPFLYVFNDQITLGATPTTLSNPNLIWETTTSTNFGIDAFLFNDRLSFTADYFVKTTSDMIVDGEVPRFVGAFPAKINAGSITNRGIELGLNYRNYEGKLGYEVGINFTSISNVIDTLGPIPFIESGSVSRAGNTTRTEPGFEIAYFYGLQTNGVFNDEAEVNAHNVDGALIQPLAKPGDVRFVDQDGDGDIDADDRIYLGSGTPDFQANLNVNLTYEGFDLRIFATSVFGNEIVNGMYQPFNTPLGYSNSTTERLNRWTPDNPTSDIPRMTILDANQNTRFSDLYVEDGSYLRIKNVTLGYTFNISAIGLSRMRVYVAGDNLFTFTNYSGWDPEIGELFFNPFFFGVDQANYPQARRLRAGVDVRF